MPWRFEVDDQLEFRGLLDRQVGRLRALKDPAGVDADWRGIRRKVASVAHQSAGCGKLAPRHSPREPVARRIATDWHAPAVEERSPPTKRVSARSAKGGEGGIDLAAGAAHEGPGFAARRRELPRQVSRRYSDGGIGRIDKHGNRAALGTSSCSSSSRLATNSSEKKIDTHHVAAGSRRDSATRPNLTGSSPTTKTIGIVVVAALAASAAGGPPWATITATGRRTSSAASAGKTIN